MSAQPPAVNKRAHPRFEIRLAAEVRIGEREFTAVTRDLSLGGTSIEAAYAVPEDSDVDLALFVVVDGVEEASLPPLRVKASVMWTAQKDDGPLDARHVAGLRFTGLGDAQVAWLERFFK